MREILFRGKSRNNGKWYQGDLVTDAHERFIDDDIVYERVITETIGQYTGLTDKNGTKIFEGDIVRVNLPNGFRGIKEVKFANGGFLPYIIQYSSFDWGGEHTEVIGSIHDNPELLGGENL